MDMNMSGSFTVVPPCTVAPTVFKQTTKMCKARIREGVQLSYLSIKNELSQQFGPETIDRLKRIVSTCVRDHALEQLEHNNQLAKGDLSQTTILQLGARGIADQATT